MVGGGREGKQQHWDGEGKQKVAVGWGGTHLVLEQDKTKASINPLSFSESLFSSTNQPKSEQHKTKQSLFFKKTEEKSSLTHGRERIEERKKGKGKRGKGGKGKRGKGEKGKRGKGGKGKGE